MKIQALLLAPLLPHTPHNPPEKILVKYKGKGLNLMDPQSLKTRDAVFVEAYTHDIADLKDPTKSLIAEVIVDGWWKLIVPGPVKPDRPFSGVPAAPELYNLETDPMENNDLAAKHPDVVAKLRAKLEKRYLHSSILHH